jgi:hypothetical protein
LGTGIATFSWNGVYDAGYALDFVVVVPQAEPSSFGCVLYGLMYVADATDDIPTL